MFWNWFRKKPDLHIPELQRVAIVELRGGEIFVIECKTPLAIEHHRYIQKFLEQFGVRGIVLDRGLTLKAVCSQSPELAETMEKHFREEKERVAQRIRKAFEVVTETKGEK